MQVEEQTGRETSNELIAASIDQKAGKISGLPFGSAIDIRKNKRYLPLLLLPLIAASLIFIIAPRIFTEGGYRLSQPSVFFARPAPFTFHVDPRQLKVVQGQPFTLTASVQGDKLPERLFLVLGSEQVAMKAIGTSFNLLFP